MHESDAKHFAELITQLLGAPIANLDTAEIRKPITLAEILQIGLCMAVSVRKNYPEAEAGFPIPPKLLEAMYAYPETDAPVRDLLYEALLKSDEDPFSLEASLQAVQGGNLWTGFRKELRDTFDTLILPGPQGGTCTIDPEHYPDLVKRSERLRPFCLRLKSLEAQFPNKTLQELLEFLKSEFPGECAYTLARLATIQKLCQESTAFTAAKTAKREARIMADLLAGCDYKLGAAYTLQQVQEARRQVLGKDRRRKPRLPSDPEHVRNQLSF